MKKENEFQHTIKEPITLEATSLVRKKKLRIQIIPAHPGEGIVFVREDKNDAKVKASLENVVNTFRWITLREGKAMVSIVEHVLAALYITGIDNAFVLVNDRYFPSLPLSIYPYLDQIRKVGLVSQEKPRSFWLVRKSEKIEWRGRKIIVEPSNQLEIDYTIDFKESLIGQQRYTVSDNFDFETIAYARPFSIWNWLPEFLLRKVTESFVIVRRGRFLNEEQNSIRYQGTEPVRHKIIDFFGALALLGGRVKGKFTIYKSGHTFDILTLKELINSGSIIAKVA